MSRIVSIVVALLTIPLLTVPAQAGRAAPHNPPLSALFLTLATRPGLTDAATVQALGPAAGAADKAFRAALGRGAHPESFSHQLAPLLAAFEREYRNTVEGLPGAEARGAATDRLFQRLLTAARRARIPLETFDLALLSGAAAFEAELSERPAARVLSLEDRELVDLFFLTSTNQVHRRVLLQRVSAALQVFGPMSHLTDRVNYLKPIMEDNLWIELVYLEEFLADPLNLADSAELLRGQYNAEAINELFNIRLQMEFRFFGATFSLDLARLAAEMDAAGGVMTGMTVERLLQSGLTRDYSGNIVEYLPLDASIAYDWVRPRQRLSYRPLPDLAEELLELGGEVPQPPDFTFFGNPYLAVIALKVDFDLCNWITLREWNQAQEQAWVLDQGILSMAERLALRQADQSRRGRVLAHFSGANRSEEAALATLLTWFW